MDREIDKYKKNTNNEGIVWYEYVAIIAWVILLIAAIFMLINFYVCDSKNCKAFKQSCNIANEKEKVLSVLGALGNDGVWCFPFIAASISSFMIFWFIRHPITIREFAIVFITQFLVIFVIFSFYNHHYIKPIKNYVADYIQNST